MTPIHLSNAASRLFNNPLALSVLTAALPVGFQLFYVRFVSYNVDPAIYGAFALLLSLVAANSTFFWTVPSAAFTRYYNETSNKSNFINEFRSILFGVHVLSALFLLLYHFFTDKFSDGIILVVILLVIAQNSLSLNKQITLQNLFRKKYLLLSASEKILKYILPIFFFHQFETLEALVSGSFISVLLVFSLSILLNLEYRFKFRLILKKIKIYFLYAFPLVFTSVFSWIIVFSDRYFISHFLSDHQLGIYAILGQVASFAIILNVIFSMYVNPIIYRLHGEDRFASFQLLSRYIYQFGLILVSILVVVIIVPKNFFYFLINPEIIQDSQNYHTFQVLVVASILSVFQNSLSLVFTLNKRLDVLAVLWGLAAVVNLTLNFFISDYGIVMAACSTSSAYFVVVLGNFYWLWRCARTEKK